MDESSKTKQVWTKKHFQYLSGSGIDIGCGNDPILPNVYPFDMAQGDANEVTKYVNQTFDFVFSSHCLEHMRNPSSALLEWWQLVRPGGYLFFLVPDEDLYEQGVWPSRFNSDHKATFTISKAQSWSPVSHNVLDLVAMLPNAQLIEVTLHDHNYDRSKMQFGSNFFVVNLAKIIFYPIKFFFPVKYINLQKKILRWIQVDQTLRGALAQIQCIVKKMN